MAELSISTPTDVKVGDKTFTLDPADAALTLAILKLTKTLEALRVRI